MQVDTFHNVNSVQRLYEGLTPVEMKTLVGTLHRQDRKGLIFDLQVDCEETGWRTIRNKHVPVYSVTTRYIQKRS